MKRVENDIAIIGMAGRFPGARDLETFWENLRAGRDSISRFSREELLASDYALEEVLEDPGFVPARGVLEDIDLFDAGFFGFRPREAASLDPQQRLWFECAWEALEHAGIAPAKTAQRIGVFAGGGYLNTYLMLNLCQDRDAVERLVRLRSVDAFQNIINNDKDFLPTRTSHLFGLTGPSVNVQTACSTSLVSVVMAAQSLVLGESDVCLAGGISIQLPQVRGYLAQEGGMDSFDGVLRPFDARANGTVFGNGVGVVVLKRLADAERDGDRVLAVLKGYALNNDGSRRASYVAPSPEGQMDVIRRALAMAGGDAGGLSYVEAHGTGTSTGDPIEVNALSTVFAESADRRGYCGIGSVKGNVGHLDSAAGVVGLIKVLLALEHEELPPSIHFDEPNPKIDFENSPFYVVRENTRWTGHDAPRRAAISSFGVGGTNAHVVLEEAPVAPAKGDAQDPPWHLLALSARSEAALEARCADLAAYLASRKPPLGAVASTLMNRREDMPYRRFLVAEHVDDAHAALASDDARRLISGVRRTGTDSVPAEVVFLFPGQGAQAPGMGQGLFETEPVFRDTFLACSEGFEPLIGVSLRELLYPAHGQADEDAEEALKQTRLAQPAMFSVELALARLWEHWGLRPAAMMGHSLGDFTAACLAGVFSLEGAIAAIAARSRLMQECRPGAMLAVQQPLEAVEELLAGQEAVALAAVNGPTSCVVAGDFEAVENFADRCAGQDIESTRLRTSHAFHSEMMRPAAERFREALSDIDLAAPEIAMVSSRTGRFLTAEEAVSPDFWARQILDPVRFHDGVKMLSETAGRVFLEVGPGTTLSSLARQAGASKSGVVISSLGHAKDQRPDRAAVLEAAGRLWLADALPQPSPLFTPDLPALPLPTYPFQRTRHWVDAPRSTAGAPGPSTTLPEPVAAPDAGAAQPTTSTDNAMSTSKPEAPSRLPRIRSALADVFEEYSGLDVAGEGPEMTFLEMGFDSLFLTQIATALQNQFGVRMKFRRMLEDLCTLDRLTEFFDESLPPEEFAEARNAAEAATAPAPDQAAPPQPESATTPTQAAAASVPPALPAMTVPVGAGAVAGDMAQSIVQQQLAIMQQQIALLTGAASVAPAQTAQAASAAAPDSAQQPPQVAAEPPGAGVPEAGPSGPEGEAKAPPKPQAFGAQARISTEHDDEFTPRQRACFDAFLERYVEKTGKSKAFTQEHRKVMSDPRVVTGFRPLWKELVYPIVVDRSKGSRLWDLDGNEYVDLTCGFGSNFLGNQPDFLADAIRKQIDLGYEVGPQHPLTADVARLISELTGMERVAFCNTGSEAVMGAMRAARTITGRSLVAIFSNSYHGIFDEVIVRGTKTLRSIAAAPGILASAVENVLVLEYGAPETLEILKERGHELAAIMAEPVQSRNPKLQPREFLKALRTIADDCGAALIFDEVITGFRISPGGAQEYFGVRADLATYGKIIGGGLPFAAIAGGSRFMDALDGGHWAFGDDSYPEVGVTYFAGTFVRHPLALAAARASLEHLKAEGPALQRDLNERTTAFVEGLRDLFARTGAPITIDQFGSLCRLTVSEDEPFGSLLYYWLRDHGVHIWEGFGTFLTTAHSDEDVRHLHEAFEASIRELQAGDLLSGHAESGTDSAIQPGEVAGDPGADAGSGRIPMTDAQQEIWLASQMEPAASCAYNESFTLQLDGDLDVQAFRDAVEWVSSRHDALRLRFDSEGGYQYLVPFEAPELPVHDWRQKTGEDARKALDAVLEHEATEPFDLESGPLIRDALYRLEDTRCVFVSTAHHIVFDGWSAGVYLDEIGYAYSRLRAGEKPDRPPVPGFVDYVRNEAREIRSENGKRALRYWKEVYQDPPPPLELPLVRERPDWRTFEARSLHWAFKDETYQAARRAAARSNTTLYSLLFTTFGAYLGRLTGQDDLVIGIPTAGQAISGEYSLIGHCVNILPVRVRVERERKFDEMLADTARLILDAQEHQPATLGSILRHAPIQRLPGRPPLVEVVFNLNRKLPEESFEGLNTRIREVQKRSLIWDMFLNCSEEEGRLTTDFDYNADLFDEASIRRFLEGFEHLLAAVSAKVAQPVGTLPVMTGEAEAAVLAFGRGAELPVEPGTVLERFRAQVAERPDSPAVRHQQSELTYAELDRASDAVASSLHAAIGDTESQPVVGICMPRSEQLLVAILGAWKAGCAYLPLDPGFPHSRLSYMAEDAGAALLMVDGEAPLNFNGPVISMDTLLSAEDARPPTPALAGELAYVIYTSGSTGKPKGVCIGHDQVANLLQSMAREPGLEAKDVLLAVTTLSFDISVLELLLPITVGAIVHVAGQEEASHAQVLMDLLETSGATVLQATPSTWRMLIDADWTGKPNLKALCGGEALPRNLVESLLPRVSSLWNLYGPTETTVWSSVDRVLDADGPITVGRPIDNTFMAILDEHGAPVPIGVVGELTIGGAGVAAGYLGLDDLTRERFPDNPFSDTPGARMYRTGDLARFLPDGRIEHMGRADNQVKVRGFRIELAEIESCLDQLPGVDQSLVKVFEPAPGDQRLVAYLVGSSEQGPNSIALRKALRKRLPDYMIPQHFQQLDALPLTPNGKIDRRALPEPEAFVGTGQAFVAPATETEQAIAAIWSELIGVEQVGREDNFFELGGHSLLAMRAIRQMVDVVGIRVPPQHLIMDSLKEIAQAVESRGAA
ncbi:MAG: amino acid adenylation domain-containing protein [Xanthomonadales bacterium]|jgi:amino acid adenylation domain-containing protein|nr:amino acid adenylation domain-containing protein [Xanthomonadales bacterium]